MVTTEVMPAVGAGCTAETSGGISYRAEPTAWMAFGSCWMVASSG